MTTRIECDGCGGLPDCPHRPAGDATFVEVGFVRKAHYCAEALRLHEAYLVERDALHDRIAAEWRRELAALEARYEGLKVIADDA